MKISKQERILIVVFLVAAIIGIGIFVFILPNFNKISDNNKQLASVNKQYADINKQLEHESTIDNEISQAYEDGKNLADKFSTTSQNTRLTRLCVSLLQMARI